MNTSLSFRVRTALAISLSIFTVDAQIPRNLRAAAAASSEAAPASNTKRADPFAPQTRSAVLGNRLLTNLGHTQTASTAPKCGVSGEPAFQRRTNLSLSLPFCVHRDTRELV